jgi:outer membrane receptor protein involved in Fe transport
MIRNERFSRGKLRAGAALQALALISAGAGLAAVGTAPAAAQDYTSGAIGGTVKDEAGNAVSGATVTITSTAQGTKRTATTGSTGSFLINGLPNGTYDVTVESQNAPSWTASAVDVRASQTAQLNVNLAASGGQDIVVTGKRAVAAFSGTTVGLNVDVASFIETKPLARNLTSVILLAPGTSLGDGAFGNLPSIAGASVAENQYYVNGMNVTNFDNGLGSTTLPFYFIKSVDVKNGGLPAEYGRATGGVITQVTKSGSNDYMAAAHIDWTPNFLVSPGKNLQSFTGNTVNGSQVQNSTDTAYNRSDTLQVTLEASGPVIKDRLFVYGLVQMNRVTSLSNSPLAGSAYGQGTAYSYRNDDPFWGAKVDAYPIDSQHLEFTIFDTRNTNQRSDVPYTYGNGPNVYGAATAVTGFNRGGVSFVGKYTGRMTDWLTLSAAYGRTRDRFDQVSIAGAGNLPSFQNASGGTVFGVGNGGYYNAQRNGSTDFPFSTERKFFRADADLLFTLLGDHHIRGGYDQEDNTLDHVTVRNGGAYEFANNAISPAAYNALAGGAGFAYIVRPSNAGGPVVELNYYNTGGMFKAKNKAYYIQDEWKPTDRLTLTLGARRDDFRINKPSGAPIADLKKNYAPRIGAEYRIFGDKSGKFYASYGWEYLPIASNTAYRQGSPSFYFRQRYNFSGIGSNGLPVLTNLVTNNGQYQSKCPFALVPNGATTNCNVTGDGADINTTQAISANLKATRQTEIIAGYEQTFGLWRVGLTYTHRNLDRTSEDSAIDAAVNAYCTANNIRATPTGGGASVACSDIWDGYHQYVINNPGSDITVNLLANGYDINNRTVTLSAKALGYGKAKRTYDAAVLYFDRGFDGLYGLGGSYTYSRARGNIEGAVQSDFGQVDAGITQDFDQPGFVDYSYGNLPNNYNHIIKLWGNIKPVETFNVGAFVQVQSPRSLSCFGWHPTDLFADGYGAASHYCNGKPSPRGTAQKSDWQSTINLQFAYSPKIEGHSITFRADVFNLLNSQAITKRNEIGELDVTTSPTTGLPVTYIANPNYGRASAYQAPRYVRLGVDINF